MALNPAQVLYRDEFVASFEQRQSYLRDTVTNEAMVKGSSAVFLVTGQAEAMKERGVDGLIPASNEVDTQITVTPKEIAMQPQTITVTADGTSAVGRDHVDRVIGQIAQHQSGRIDLLALPGPFGRERLGQGLARNQLRSSALALHRAAIECDAPQCAFGHHFNSFVEPLHGRGVFHFRARNTGATSRSIIPIAVKAQPAAGGMANLPPRIIFRATSRLRLTWRAL